MLRATAAVSQHGIGDVKAESGARFRGTEVHLSRTYERPGPIPKVVSTFKHDNPSQREFDELLAFKQILETGDTVTSDAWANGVYGGFIDAFPMGAVMNRSLKIRTGQCHVHRYMPLLLEHITAGRIDPSFVITHHMPLSEAAHGYEIFVNKQDNCEKIVLKAA